MQILLADRDSSFTTNILEQWDLQDVSLMAVTSDQEIIPTIEQEDFSAVFLSASCLTVNNLDILSFIREHQHNAEIIMLCDTKNIALAEECLSRGASSYLLKPVSTRTLQDASRKAVNRLQSRKNYRLMEDHVLEDLLGNTPNMRKVLRTMYKVAPTNSSILITGESGTGKEFVANILHRLSKRSDEAFIAVNCGAIPENIVESELFGVKKGAFTGAVADKRGLFEEADQGTLFLDEVGELPPPVQVKLLRFLQEREVRRVGDTESRKVDVRVIAATNMNLHQAMESGKFREDLFYRLNTFQLHLPPLRERMQTLPNLVKHFLLRFSQQEDKEIVNIEPAALLALSQYDYPGNVRELSNIIEHAVVMAETGTIFLDDLPEEISKPHTQQVALPPSTGGHYSYRGSTEKEISPKPGNTATEFITEPPILAIPKEETVEDLTSLAQVEKEYISKALKILKSNQTETAKILGISRSTLWRKVQDHGIEI